MREDAERIEQRKATTLVTSSIEQIVPAAYEGRIEAIFVASDSKLWESYDAAQS